MSRYAVNKVLWQIGRDDALAARFVEAPEQFLASHPLTETERRQLLERDIGAMFAAGAHPFLLYTFSLKMAQGWSPAMMVEYVKAVSAVAPPHDILT